MLSRGAGSVPRVMVFSMLVRRSGETGNVCVKHLAIHDSLGASGPYQSACQSTDPLSLVDKGRELSLIPTFSGVSSIFFSGLATSKERKELRRHRLGGFRFIYVYIRKRVTVKTQNTINRIYTKENIGLFFLLGRKKSQSQSQIDPISLLKSS